MTRAAASGERREAAWAHVAERGSTLGIRLMVWIRLHLGRRVTEILLYPVVAYFCVAAGDARRASRRYFERLARHAPDCLPPRPLLGRTFRHFYAFATMIVDRLCLWTGNAADLEIEIHGREAMQPLIDARRGAVLLGAHLGSFDVLRAVARSARVPVTVVMFTANTRRINDVLAALDPESAVRTIEVDPGSIRAGFEIRDRIERGEFVAVLADRVAPSGRSRIGLAPFLGAPAAFPEGPFLLPLLLGLPSVLCLALARGAGRYDVFLEPFGDGAAGEAAPRREIVARSIARFASRLEHYALLEPYQWFNFYDVWAEGRDA